MGTHLIFGVLIGVVGAWCILITTVYPLIFWLYVIPKIQKRVGGKMTYNPKFYCYPLVSKYMAYVDIALSIFLRYLYIKIFGDQYRFNSDNQRPLSTVSYDIRYASKPELIFSFLVVLNCFFAFIALLVGGILSRVV